jgi:hypothetical protein
MFARAADTLVPATAEGVTSYADPAYGGELRLVLVLEESAAIELHDGAAATAAPGQLTFTPGDQYGNVTFELRGAAAPAAITIDDAPLPEVDDDGALFACAAPGCWRRDAATGRLQVRAIGGASIALARRASAD